MVGVFMSKSFFCLTVACLFLFLAKGIHSLIKGYGTFPLANILSCSSDIRLLKTMRVSCRLSEKRIEKADRQIWHPICPSCVLSCSAVLAPCFRRSQPCLNYVSRLSSKIFIWLKYLPTANCLTIISIALLMLRVAWAIGSQQNRASALPALSSSTYRLGDLWRWWQGKRCDSRTCTVECARKEEVSESIVCTKKWSFGGN